MIALANAVEQGILLRRGDTVIDVGFYMNTWINVDPGIIRNLEKEVVEIFKELPPDCGCVACIGGHATILFEKEYNAKQNEDKSDVQVLAEIIGISMQQMSLLCYPQNPRAWRATKRQAAATIRALDETGEVNWDPIVGGQTYHGPVALF